MSETKVQFIDVEVRPSQNYQTVGLTARVVFDEPKSIDEARFEADVIYKDLETQALARVKQLSELRPNEIQPAANTTGASTSSSDWRIANKPNNAGSFRYLPTSTMDKRTFIDRAEAVLREMGIDLEQVTVFDDRSGDRGLERGEQHYSAGKVKVKPDSQYARAMDGKAIIGSVDFADNGELRVSISRDGKTALNAIKIAGQFATLGATPENLNF
jgi:hypothetical protein